MQRSLLVFVSIVVIVEAQESASNPNSRKWSNRQVFSRPSPNSIPNPEKPTFGDKPIWGSGNVDKPISNVPSWNPGVPSWGSIRPIWSSANPGSIDFKPEIFNNWGSQQQSCQSTAAPLTADSKCCGVDAIINHRIIGGNVTHIEQHPWLVQIEYHDRDINVFKRVCGGFLISNRYVLSAAHCFTGDILMKGTPVNVILGEYDARNEGKDCILTERGTSECTDGAIKVPIEKYRVHQEYVFNKIRNLNDIAIVRLSRPVEYSKFIRPICLPSADITLSPPADLRFITAGWGAIKHELFYENGVRFVRMQNDDLKRDVDVPFVTASKCLEQFRFVNARHICAGGEAGKDSCKGDSGSPLMFNNDGVFEAVGIVSTSSANYSCGTENHVAVYTNVYQFRDWINTQIKP